MQPDTVRRKMSRSKPDRVFRQSLVSCCGAQSTPEPDERAVACAGGGLKEVEGCRHVHVQLIWSIE
jgi:hypothetical protein